MYVIGITGGIACGKSTVSNELRKYGCKIINADNMAHWQMSPDGEIYQAYIKHFGKEILNDEGRINRQKIAEKVFNDKSELDWINRITHPILLKYLRTNLVKYQQEGIPIAVLDVPLLFEAGWDKECDEVWVVQLKPSLQIKRLTERNQLSQEEAEHRIGAQINFEKRLKMADEIINNGKNKKRTRAQIRKLMAKKFPHLISNYEKYQRKLKTRIATNIFG